MHIGPPAGNGPANHATPQQERWQAAASTISPNESYVGARMLYRGPHEVEHAMADAVDQVAARAILRRLRNVLIAMWLVGVLSSQIAALTDGGSGDFGDPNGSSASSFRGTGTFLIIVLSMYLLAVLFLPARETLSEWSLVVDDRADLAESAYATVAEELMRTHQIPAQVTPRRLFVRSPQRGIRNFLAIRLGKYTIMVSVFPFGRDLFLGWSLVRRDLPVVVVLRYLASKLGTDAAGYSRLIDVEPVKALRDVVHNALRTGIEAAALRRQLSVDAVFEYPIPVEDGEPAATRAEALRTAPQPYQQTPYQQTPQRQETQQQETQPYQEAP
jgi:hypothetical protein